MIIAHNDWTLLNQLLSCIDDKRNSVFIHIDKKSDFKIDDIYVPTEASCIYIKRRKVTWGGWSMIAAELDLITAAIESAEFDYLHLLSGQDLPLKTSGEIHEWFDEHQGSNYIAIDRDPENRSDVIGRITKYWLFQNCVGRSKGIIYSLLRRADVLCSWIQKIFKVDRTRKISMKIYKGPQWFSITGEMAREILKHRKEIQKWFQWSFCADEMFLQTIAYNSPLKETIVNDSLRAIDWERGNPYTFTREDEGLLLNSGDLFARKFSTEVDREIIEIIYKRASCEEVL